MPGTKCARSLSFTPVLATFLSLNQPSIRMTSGSSIWEVLRDDFLIFPKSLYFALNLVVYAPMPSRHSSSWTSGSSPSTSSVTSPPFKASASLAPFSGPTSLTNGETKDHHRRLCHRLLRHDVHAGSPSVQGQGSAVILEDVYAALSTEPPSSSSPAASPSWMPWSWPCWLGTPATARKSLVVNVFGAPLVIALPPTSASSPSSSRIQWHVHCAWASAQSSSSLHLLWHPLQPRL